MLQSRYTFRVQRRRVARDPHTTMLADAMHTTARSVLTAMLEAHNWRVASLARAIARCDGKDPEAVRVSLYREMQRFGVERP